MKPQWGQQWVVDGERVRLVVVVRVVMVLIIGLYCGVCIAGRERGTGRCGVGACSSRFAVK